MADYMSRTERETLICIAGCQTFMDVILDGGMARYKPMSKQLKTVRTLLRQVMERVLEGVDPDQLRGINRTVQQTQLVAMTKHNPKAAANSLWVVDSAAVERICKSAVADCMICNKDAKQVQQCQLRKDLLECGIIPRRRGKCPYQAF